MGNGEEYGVRVGLTRGGLTSTCSQDAQELPAALKPCARRSVHHPCANRARALCAQA